MKQYVFKDSGKPAIIGHFYSIHTENCFVYLKLTQPALINLIKIGVVVPVESKEAITDLQHYLKLIQNKTKLSTEQLTHLSNVYPVVLLSMVMREIAIELDKAYTDHISQSKELYVFSTSEGRIMPMDPKRVESYKYFAAFRNMQDVRLACHIARPIIKKMYAK